MTEQSNPNEADGIQQPGVGADQSNVEVLRNHNAMLKEIQSWGLWSLGLGALHIISTGFLSAPWGILLLIVGVASYFFQSASMFIVYAVTLAWAALSNLTGSNAGWVIFALFQIFLSVRVFLQYRHFRKAENAYISMTTENVATRTTADRTARFFPWIGSLLGCSSITGLVSVIVIVIIISVQSKNSQSIPGYYDVIAGLLVNLGVLGFAIGLASLLSKYRPKALAIIGLVASVLTLVIELALRFLSKTS